MSEFNEIECIEGDPRRDFTEKTIAMFEDFLGWFKGSLIYNPIFKDPKRRKIDFLLPLYPGTKSIIPEDETIADSYCIDYRVSMASLAQLQRHRSIKYDIGDFLFDSDDSMLYCPTFINKNEELQREWREDMVSVMSYYPQGQVVRVVERGTIDKFLLKCDERLCGRVQLETMDNCKMLVNKFFEYGKFSPYYEEQVRNWIRGVRSGMFDVRAKCEMRGECADNGCIHGPKNALHRDF